MQASAAIPRVALDPGFIASIFDGPLIAPAAYAFSQSPTRGDDVSSAPGIERSQSLADRTEHKEKEEAEASSSSPFRQI